MSLAILNLICSATSLILLPITFYVGMYSNWQSSSKEMFYLITMIVYIFNLSVNISYIVNYFRNRSQFVSGTQSDTDKQHTESDNKEVHQLKN